MDNKLKINKDLLRKYALNPKQLENQRTIASLYLMLTLFSISFFGLLAINPTISTISSLQKQYDDGRLIDESLTQKINSLGLLSDQYGKIEPSLEKIYSAVPATTKAAYFLRQIQVIAKNNNIQLQTLEEGKTELFPAEKQKEANNSLEFNLSFSASKTDANNFINVLIKFDRIITINEINMYKNSFEQKLPFNVSIKGTAYFNKL